MSLLSPWIFAAALAAMAVPIAILHMLKLRRSPRRVSSTLLWRRTVEDLVANAPFQRLRWSLLLLLQIAAALAVAAALGRPTSSAAPGVGSRTIVLIDRSASMSARIESGADAPARTRLDLARDEVRRLIDSRPDRAEMMLVGFGLRPQALCSFELSRERLLEAIDGLRPSDEEADLDAALALASALAREAPEEVSEGGALPAVVVVTDGNVRPPVEGAFEVAAGAVQVHLVDATTAPAAGVQAGRHASSEAGSDGASGASPPALDHRSHLDNLGITALAIERGYDDPAMVSLFARIANAAPEPAETVLTVRAGDRVMARRSIDVPAANGRSAGEATLLERFEMRGGALVIVEHGRSDRLDSDDVAATILPPARQPRIVVVAPDGQAEPFLLAVLEAVVGGLGSGAGDGGDPTVGESAGVRVLSPSQWSGRRASASPDERAQGVTDLGDAGGEPDLVVFDRVAPQGIPDVPSLTVGAAPSWLPSTAGDTGEPRRLRRVLSWTRSHPLLRHVDLDDIVYGGFAGFSMEEVDPGLAAEALALGPDGPVLAALIDRGTRHAVLGFPLRRSNLPALPAFPVLVQNAIDWLVASGAGDAGRTWRPGDTVVVRAAPGVSRLELRSPDGETHVVMADEPGGRAVLPPLERSGLWIVQGAVADDEQLAVSVLSELESNLALGASAISGASSDESAAERAAGLAIAVTAPRDRRIAEQRHSDLWPVALGAALILLLLEGLLWAVRAGRSNSGAIAVQRAADGPRLDA